MLELKNTTKVFNKADQKGDDIKALDNVSLTINDGEFVTIIGSNGSGKSTTMNIITGSIQPDKGSIILNGKDITKMKEYQRAKFFSRVFQDPKMGTASEMSVLENLEMAYRRGKRHSPLKWGFSKNKKEFYKEELKRFDLGIEDRMNKKVGLMSGGQRQALTLLMAVIQNVDVLLLDEHTAALDPKTAKKVMELTEQIVKERKITTIMITHSMTDAIRYGDRLIMYNEGHIVHDISKEEKKNLTISDLLNWFKI